MRRRRDRVKIVFSRKGFDAQYGGMPSPIMPDGRLVPLPIPSTHDSWTLADAALQVVEPDKLIRELSKGRHSIVTTVHLDPFLTRESTGAPNGWRPILGQTGAAQGHLANQGVTSGDIFLFFGWFRRVELHGGKWRYVPGAPDLHLIFGWLEIGSVLALGKDRARCLEEFPWIADHPHVSNPAHYASPLNCLYIASDASRMAPSEAYGAGRFSYLDERLVLTAQGYSRTYWRLPAWFEPGPNRPPMSYHPLGERWQRDAEGVILRTASKGQEFVLDGAYYPDAPCWAKSLIEGG